MPHLLLNREALGLCPTEGGHVFAVRHLRPFTRMSSAITPVRDPFAGGGEMRSLCREVDWSATPLGRVDQWPPALRTLVRTALDSPFPICLWCGEDRVLIYNDAYRHVLGAKHPHALGRPGWEVWAEIWPQIGPFFEQIRAGGPPIYAEDAPFVVERRNADRSGADGQPNAWFTFSLSPVYDDADDIVAFLNIVSDRTPRVLSERAREEALAAAERAEARLREVFAQAPAFMAVLRGEQLVFEYANDAYYQLVGHRPLIGLPVFDALPDLRGQGFEQLLHSVIESGTPFVGRELSVHISRTPGAPPEERFLDFVYYPVRRMHGVESGVVAHGYDVTEHVLARDEARRARAEAEHANQAKSQFLANMSHEIRTPINAVVGYTDLLDADVAGALTPRQHEFVERIRASSQHLLALVNDVLDLSKIEAGEMMVRTGAVAVRPVAASALQMLAAEAEARGLTLEEQWNCSDITRFAGDEDRVRQILLNLLSNALKFTSPGGAITVRCATVPSASPEAALPDRGPWVVIEVEDTGTGIPEDQQSRIFEAFVQAEAGHTRRVGGTGLGLTISRRFARLMSGDLIVRSEVGKGSCFSLWLPALVQDRVSAGVTQPAVREWPPPADVSPFHAVGQLLLESAELLEEELVWKLRMMEAAERIPDAERAQLADHTAVFLAGLGRSVTAMEDPALHGDMLRDGAEVRGIVAARHGAQRRRLGWQRSDIEHEYQILRELLETFMLREAFRRTAIDPADALNAMHRLLDDARAASLAAFAAAEP